MNRAIKIGKILRSIVLIPIILFGLLQLEQLVQYTKDNLQTQNQENVKAAQYNNLGLSHHETLSDHLIFENERYAFYEDRILDKSSPKEDATRRMKEILFAMEKEYSNIEHIYVAPVPKRILFETDFSDSISFYDDFFKGIQYESSKVDYIDILSSLKEHSDEYLYFRTENSWTARGAYYAFCSILDEMNLTPPNLEDYREYIYNDFYGSLYRIRQQQIEDSNQLDLITSMEADPLYYYLLPSNENHLEVLSYDKNQQVFLKRPIVIKSETGLPSFISGRYQYGIIRNGNALQKDKNLLLLCDSIGKLTASYFSDYFSNVYIYSVDQYQEDLMHGNQLIQDKQITDIVWIQDYSLMGDFTFSHALTSLIDQEMR